MTANYFNNQQSFQEQQQDVPCVDFSAMSFGYQGSPSSFYTAASASSEQSSSSGKSRSANLSGWGSAISRKPYACLKTLCESTSKKNQRPHKKVRSAVAIQSGESWGYFVDTNVWISWNTSENAQFHLKIERKRSYSLIMEHTPKPTILSSHLPEHRFWC